jgi:hypothetical protein
MIGFMNTCMRKIGIIFKRQDERVHGIANNIVPWLQARGVDVSLKNRWRDKSRFQ